MNRESFIKKTEKGILPSSASMEDPFVISYFSRRSGKAVLKNFATLEKAKEMAQSIFLATGIVVGIESWAEEV